MSTSMFERVPFASSFKYLLIDFWQDNAEPFSSHLPLIRSTPWPTVSIVALYLLFVLKIGPSFMRNREPYQLKNVIWCYNVFHIIANAILGTTAFVITRATFDCWQCKQTGDKQSPSDTLLLYLTYFYFLAKFLDLLDTVFFILRKKTAQVTFLHVTHHSLMPVCTYLSMKFTPIGRTSIIGILNSLVHAVMYIYYYLASKDGASKIIWWKKYLTMLQIVQFIVFMLHAIQGLLFIDCPNFPMTISIMELANAMFFIKSFTDFFLRTYKSNERSLKSQ